MWFAPPRWAGFRGLLVWMLYLFSILVLTSILREFIRLGVYTCICCNPIEQGNDRTPVGFNMNSPGWNPGYVATSTPNPGGVE